MTLADFNNDGKLDALVLGQYSTPSIFLGNGDRTFQPPIPFPVGMGTPNSVVGDFNGDGKLDVVIGPGGPTGIQLLFGNGDGTVRAGHIIAQSIDTELLATADFNRDGKLDLVIGSAVYLGNGNWSFQTPSGFGSIRFAAVTAYDVNGDGFPDILTLDQSGLSVF